MSPVDPSKLNDALAVIEKEYGQQAIHKGAEEKRVDRIPTGSYALDVVTGGGIPIGRISRFWGLYSSGKTLMALKTAANAQKIDDIARGYIKSDYKPLKELGARLESRFPNGMEVAYYNVEKVWDKEWAEHLGIDTDRINIINENTIEGICEIMETLLPSIHVHIVDSASHAAPLDRINANMEDWDRGLAPRVWGKGLDHLENQFDRHDNIVILIDQARVDLTTGALIPPGGKAMEHFPSLTLQFKQNRKLYRKKGILQEIGNKNPDTLSGVDDPDGHELQVTVRKSRIGPHNFRSARMHFDIQKADLDDLFELSRVAVWYGVVGKDGSWYKYGDEKFQGQAALREKIQQDSDLRKKIEESVHRDILKTDEQTTTNNVKRSKTS